MSASGRSLKLGEGARLRKTIGELRRELKELREELEQYRPRQLPAELWFLILQLLPLREAREASMVCAAWRGLIGDRIERQTEATNYEIHSRMVSWHRPGYTSQSRFWYAQRLDDQCGAMRARGGRMTMFIEKLKLSPGMSKPAKYHTADFYYKRVPEAKKHAIVLDYKLKRLRPDDYDEIPLRWFISE